MVLRRPRLQYMSPRASYYVQRALSTRSCLQTKEPNKIRNFRHYDLSSFLEHTARVNGDTKTTTYVGTHYEYTTQQSLEDFGMQLKRIGGKSDGGIDLIGTWSLPSAPQPLNILIQCKAFSRKLEPSHVRELEGIFIGAPPGWRDPGVFAFLVSQKPATKGVRDALGNSRRPLGYILCEADGRLTQVLWNQQAEEEGLLGIGVDVRYHDDDQAKNRLVLTWRGRVVSK